MINRILEAIIAALLLAAVSVAFLAVIYRYLLDNALSWSFEVSLALLTYITFLGSYLALRRGAHLKVDVFVRYLPNWAQGVLFLFNQVLIGGVGAIMAWYGGRQVVRFAEQTTNVLEISSAWLYAAIPLAGALICVDAVVQFARSLPRIRQGLDPDSRSDTNSAPFDL
jgi:TRAP-type C4-dicarboxylate transport system permease small subunit|tara:strand:- start:109695 stop:110198 length:504 start_codon:yes stop_codon:yes gene_type:complete